MKTIIALIILAVGISSTARAECHYYTVNGKMITCCTYGNVTNCY